MPHVIVKLWPGKSEEQKKRLADRIAKDVVTILNYGEESVSIAIEEIPSDEWAKQVYRPGLLVIPSGYTRGRAIECKLARSVAACYSTRVFRDANIRFWYVVSIRFRSVLIQQMAPLQNIAADTFSC